MKAALSHIGRSFQSVDVQAIEAALLIRWDRWTSMQQDVVSEEDRTSGYPGNRGRWLAFRQRIPHRIGRATWKGCPDPWIPSEYRAPSLTAQGRDIANAPPRVGDSKTESGG